MNLGEGGREGCDSSTLLQGTKARHEGAGRSDARTMLPLGPTFRKFVNLPEQIAVALQIENEKSPLYVGGAARVIAQADDPSSLRAVLADPPDAMKKGWFTYSLMGLAAGLGREHSIKVLLEAGFSAEEAASRLHRPMILAALSGKVGCLLPLLDARADVGRVDHRH